MSSLLISCIFNCGQSISQNEIEKHIRAKCKNRLKYIYCSEGNQVYGNESKEMSNHIKVCENCKMKKVDIDIINKNRMVAPINSKGNKKKSSQPITKAKMNNPSLDDTMFNIQLNKKRVINNQDINNTMIMSNSNNNTNVNRGQKLFDESFMYSQQENNDNDNMIREYEDEEGYEKNEDEFNSYFINGGKTAISIQLTNKIEDKEDDENSSSDYEDYFV